MIHSRTAGHRPPFRPHSQVTPQYTVPNTTENFAVLAHFEISRIRSAPLLSIQQKHKPHSLYLNIQKNQKEKIVTKMIQLLLTTFVVAAFAHETVEVRRCSRFEERKYNLKTIF